MDWDGFKVFSAVAQAGSVRGAAGLLGVNASTVSRRLEQFERSLGVRLFDRANQGLRLTPAGAAVRERVDGVAAELLEVTQALKGQDQSLAGAVRFALPEALAASLVMASLVPFTQQFPDVELTVLPITSASVSDGNADLEIRAIDEPPVNLIAQPLGRYAVAVYRREGTRDRRWIGWRRQTPLALLSASVRAQQFESFRTDLTADHVLLQLAAARAGLGAALLPCVLGDSAADLERLSEPEAHPAQPLWLLSQPEQRGNRRVQELSRFLREMFESHVDMLLGRGTIGN